MHAIVMGILLYGVVMFALWSLVRVNKGERHVD